MPVIIVDNSVLAAHFLPDEDGGLFLKAISADDASLVAPAFLKIEFANVITISRRRQRVTEEQASLIFSNFSSLPIYFDSDPLEEVALLRIHALAADQELSFYDAIYLDLAARTSAQLATLDTRLQAIAQQTGIPIFS